MSVARSPAANRILIRDTLGSSTPGDGASLRNIITTPYPDGVECYVVATQTLYRLVKTSTATPIGTTVIAPVGGAGRWFQVNNMDAVIVDPLAVTQVGTNTFPAASPNWTAPTTNNFTNDTFGSFGTWSAPVSGLFTYSGPSGVKWRIQLDMTVGLGGATELITAAISKNVDLVGATSGQGEGSGEVSRSTTLVGRITVVRNVTLTTGDTIQPRIKNSGSASVTSTFLTMTAEVLEAA